MKHLRLVTIMAIVLGIIWSCQKEDDISPQKFDTDFSGQEKMMKLGEQLENPYLVENMQKALKELNSNGLKSASIDETIIQPTHLYIKFIPKNEEELNILKTDSTLCLYDYPLDYEIEEGGDYYHDPEVPEDQPTYQYAAVEVGQKLSEGVEYTVLSELYILEEEDNEEEEPQLKSATVNYNDWLALEDKALEITGNLEEESSEDSQLKGWFSRRSKWRPAGRIQVWDDNMNRYVGVEGVKVRARRWFTTHTGIANSSGYYSCNGRFRRDANYSIVWERYNFEIRKSWLGSAKYDGPKRKGNWDLNIKNGSQEFYATIFRAAHHYYYKNIKGLRRPPQNSFWKTQLKIRAYNENNNSNGSHKASRRFLGLGSAIKIYNPQNNSRDIYATTIHELAHASHWNMDRSTYRNIERDDQNRSRLAESWARGVQWELTRMVYTDYRGGATISPWYTQVVVDMIDPNYSSSNYYVNLNNGLWNDNVTGYTIRQLEDALKGQRNWNGWKNNIKNKYNNGTENNLEALFDYWTH